MEKKKQNKKAARNSPDLKIGATKTQERHGVPPTADETGRSLISSCHYPSSSRSFLLEKEKAEEEPRTDPVGTCRTTVPYLFKKKKTEITRIENGKKP